MHLPSGKILAVVAHPLIRHQVHDIVALDQRLGQRLGGKQVTAGTTGGDHHQLPFRVALLTGHP